MGHMALPTLDLSTYNAQLRKRQELESPMSSYYDRFNGVGGYSETFDFLGLLRDKGATSSIDEIATSGFFPIETLPGLNGMMPIRITTKPMKRTSYGMMDAISPEEISGYRIFIGHERGVVLNTTDRSLVRRIHDEVVSSFHNAARVVFNKVSLTEGSPSWVALNRLLNESPYSSLVELPDV